MELMSNKAIVLSLRRLLGVKYIAAALVVLASSASYAVEVVRWSPRAKKIVWKFSWE